MLYSKPEPSIVVGDMPCVRRPSCRKRAGGDSRGALGLRMWRALDFGNGGAI